MRKRLNRLFALGGSLTVVFSILLILFGVTSVTATPNETSPIINEFVIDIVNQLDTHEYIEIWGDANGDYSAYTLLVIEGDLSSGQRGFIDRSFPVGNTNSSGYWTTGFLQSELENGTSTILLVKDYVAPADQDLDDDDDGVLDANLPWTEIADDVGVHDGNAGDYTYGTVTLTVQIDAASRIPDHIDTDSAADWVSNDPDGEGLPGFLGTPDVDEALNTPAAENKYPEAAELVINEIDYDQPGSDQAEFFEIKNNDVVTVNLYTYDVELVNQNGSPYDSMSLPPYHLRPGGYFVACSGSNNASIYHCDFIFSGGIQNGIDAVALWFDSDLVDTVSYEGDTAVPYTEDEGVVPGDDDPGQDGISRIPDGIDSNHNSNDFSQRCLTPGFANSIATTDCNSVFVPSLTLTVTAVPLTVTEPGGNVNFTVALENSGLVSVTVTSLDENVIGSLDGEGNCVLPLALLSGEIVSCQYTDFISGAAGQQMTRTITATANNKNDVQAMAVDSATVTITEPGPEPSLTLTVTAVPLTVTEPGGNVDFAVDLENSGLVSVTVTGLDESVIGSLAGQGNCALPVVLLAGEITTCQYEDAISGIAGQQVTRVITATGHNIDNVQAVAVDSATVTISEETGPGPEPSLTLTVTAVPLTVTEPGGDVNFALELENSGLVSVTITSLVENVIGSLAGQGNCALPVVLQAGEFTTCQYEAAISGMAGQQVTRVITATGQDGSDRQAAAVDSVTVTITEETDPGPGDSSLYLPLVLKPGTFGEPNNGCGESYALALNRPYSFLAEDQDDWYSFTLSNGSAVEIELLNFVPAAGQFLVYSGPCHELQRILHNGAINVNNIFDLGFLSAGTYHIWLINDGPLNGTTPYTLKVETQ